MWKPNTLPSVEFLHQCFTIDDSGMLRWALRPKHHFATISLWKTQNRRDAGKPAGGGTGNGYLRTRLDGVLFAHHRIIWKMSRGTEPPNEIDHMDRVKGNNLPENLREATRSLNCINKNVRSDNVSGLKGVGYQHGRWRARIQVKGIPIYLGSFNTPEKAATAYMRASLEHFGADGLSPKQREALKKLVIALAVKDTHAGKRKIPGFEIEEIKEVV